ncbi:MAG: chemotaxis protein MotB [Rhodovulum sulfidophilum]|uniref:Chemotaxis protein MotB n=1 Tax=Rhodovulum sulfidophilum TaxID=35806 RepID=A0A2W5NF61_RHOSU|nr:MAG: chemotaxis protein MotB [Rhodovulum sulfidophilum]
MDKGQPSITIIKRRKVVAGGHHGGAWKVAYADFVTAMMAFFLLMWLLSATDQTTRQGLADYFSPTIPIHRLNGGGDGPYEGVSFLGIEATLVAPEPAPGRAAAGDAGADARGLAEIEKALGGTSGDAALADPLLRHIATRITDEGLIIEVFDVPGSPLFDVGAARPNPIFDELVAMIGRVIARARNRVALAGHLAPGDRAGELAARWTLSADRAQAARAGLVAAGVAEARLVRVAGKADREPATAAPDDPRNRRVEITLLRDFPGPAPR